MKRTTILILAMTAVLMLAQTALAVDEIYLEDKALEYDWWYQEYCCMGYGGVTEVVFEDEQLTTFKELGGAGDSTIWTGTYLAGQAFRYAVTGDEDAKQNAIDTVMALHTHLQITGEPGYIARYAAPIEWPFDELYTPSHSRYHFGEGEWEGSYWIGETSRDQYTGWMFGMALAYDFIDDEAIRDLIREDIVEVVARDIPDSLCARS